MHFSTNPNKSLWRGARIRSVAVVLAFPVVLLTSLALLDAVGHRDLDIWAAAILLAPVAILAGFAGRIWVLGLPAGWAAVMLLALRLADQLSGGCSVCGGDEDWGNYPLFFFIIAVLPLTAAMTVGLFLQQAARAQRRARRARPPI